MSDEFKITPLERAVSRLGEGLTAHQRNPSDTLIRDGLVQRFEFTYEISQRLIRRYLAENVVSPETIAEMTFADMEAWRNDPEGLEAVLAGLMPKPAPVGEKAPLHVGTAPRAPVEPRLPVAIVDVGGGKTATVTLLADAIYGDNKGAELPMLKPANGPGTAASAEKLRQSTTRTKGAELPADTYRLTGDDVDPMWS